MNIVKVKPSFRPKRKGTGTVFHSWIVEINGRDRFQYERNGRGSSPKKMAKQKARTIAKNNSPAKIEIYSQNEELLKTERVDPI